MNISTTVIVKIVDILTREELSTASGKSSDAIIPRIGDNIELKADTVMHKVTSVTHSYSQGYRNIITVSVREVEKAELPPQHPSTRRTLA
jgi:hypothetical protein